MLYVLLAILIIIAFMLIRTLSLKPTEAMNVKMTFEKDERSQKYGEGLSKMIQVETISSRFDDSREKFYKFHELLEELFPLVHKHMEKKVFDGSLLFKWKGETDNDPIILMSHHDVVEANGTWEHEPFSGDIDETGRVWGRGTVDTKTSLYCIFEAVEELLEKGYKPNVDVYIASSCTEEWGGPGATTTVNYLKEQGLRFALVLDEGGMILEEPIAGVKGTYGMVGVVEKGYGDIKFIAKSSGGHASAPSKNTPLVRLGKFMADVEKNNPFIVKFTPTVEEMFKRVAPNMNFGMKFIFANMNIFKPLLKKVLPAISPAAGAMLQTTLAFTMAKGADGLNVLPTEAYVTGNMRYIQHQPTDESIALISKIASKYNIETEVITKFPPYPIVDFNSDAFHLIEKVSADIYPGVQICPYVMTGGTDARFYSEISDYCIRFAPLYIDKQQYGSIHGLNENIYSGALVKGVDFYKEVIKRS